MLNIQKEILSGKSLEEICSPIGVDFKEKDGKVLFSYDMIESYKHKENPIVKECRGLILYRDNWDIACYPFNRFLNYGETGADILPDNLEGCEVLEKLDGSMISLYFDRNKQQWVVSTRGMIEAEGSVNNCINKTFSELFWEAAEKTNIKNYLQMRHASAFYKNYTLVFELCSPENRIVTPYKDTFITLLTARNNDILTELSRVELQKVAEDLGCQVVKKIDIKNWEELLHMEQLDPCFEGYVVICEQPVRNHLRVKVKNPAYLQIHKIATGISEKGFLELIKLNKHDDYISYFPEHKGHIQKLLDGLKKIVDTICTDWMKMPVLNLSQDYKKNKKEFAMVANKTMFPNILFYMYDKQTSVTDIEKYILGIHTDNLIEMIKKVNNEQ